MPGALNNPAKFRVAIMYVLHPCNCRSKTVLTIILRSNSGAGLGGLIFALLMQKHAQDTVEVDIYESARELTEIGAGVAMWPRIWEIVRYLGLEDELLEISGAGRMGGKYACGFESGFPVLPSLICILRVALPMVFTKSDEPTAVDITALPPGRKYSYTMGDTV